MNGVSGHLRVQRQPGDGGATVSVLQTRIPLSCCEHPPTQYSHPSQTFKVSASDRSANIRLPPLAHTHMPPESLKPAPEQRPGPCEQAVHQRDTDIPPLPTVLSRSRRGQQLQPPVHPPEGGEGGSGHKKSRGSHGLAGRLGLDQSLVLLTGPMHPMPAAETAS